VRYRVADQVPVPRAPEEPALVLGPGGHSGADADLDPVPLPVLIPPNTDMAKSWADPHPVGTAGWEETALRGVLRAALRRALPTLVAASTASLVFDV